MAPQSFEMAGLLQEMREMDEAAVYQQSTPQRGMLLIIGAMCLYWVLHLSSLLCFPLYTKIDLVSFKACK